MAAAWLVASASAAAPASAQEAEPGHGHALGAKIGSTGLGVEYSYGHGLFPMYGLRAALNFGSYSRTTTRSDLALEGKLEFSALMLLADAHPYRNGFRVSAGLMVNANEVSGSGRPAADTFRINGVTYPASALDRIEGKVDFRWPSPYFGVGWGAAPAGRPGLFYSFDLGVAYMRAKISLNTFCGPTLPATECDRLQADTRAQEAELREDVVDYRLFPVLTFGVGYRF